MNKHLTSLIIAAAVAGNVTHNADAYVTHGKWDSYPFTMRASSVSFPSGNPYRTALGTVRSRFYNNPSEVWYNQSYDDGSVGFDNGQCEIWFTADSDYSPAYTFWWYSFWDGDEIVEADIVFYNAAGYTTSMTKTSLWGYGGASRPFQTTCCHEIGHAAGLSHEDDEYNIMGQDWTHIHLSGTTCRSYFGEDACDGLVALYGLASGGTFEDLSVTHWKWTGASGGYSQHGMCKMYNSAGTIELGWTTFSGQRRYNVTKGSTYQVEFTFENNGETSQARSMGIYLSTDNSINTALDTLLMSTTPTVSRGDVSTWKYSITIPASLTSGVTYYIGVVVDRSAALGEYDESNNTSYHIIRVN